MLGKGALQTNRYSHYYFARETDVVFYSLPSCPILFITFSLSNSSARVSDKLKTGGDSEAPDTLRNTLQSYMSISACPHQIVHVYVNCRS